MLAVIRFSILFCFISQIINAQIPNGYYSNAAQYSGGTQLKTALHNIIKSGHTALGYSNLWSAFYQTDVKPNQKLWDIYSFVFSGPQPYEFTLGNDQCGTYSQEGDCYNREHTWPQTFFNSSDPMVSDLHQVFPTDGEVNGIHSNDPYGKVNVVSKTTQQGAKSGTSQTYPGYFNNVFEPIDSFKGDIARAYFYMNIRYTTQDGGWGNWTMANGAELTQSAITLLLNWHHLDPVSSKEINRNNKIYQLQGNRNPFVDHPEYADCIWGTANCSGVSINYTPKPEELFSVDGDVINFNQKYLPSQTKIVNTFGQEIMHFNKVTYIDISSLPYGWYVFITQINNQSYSKLFFKK
jgi:endonuclease I